MCNCQDCVYREKRKMSFSQTIRSTFDPDLYQRTMDAHRSAMIGLSATIKAQHGKK